MRLSFRTEVLRLRTNALVPKREPEANFPLLNEWTLTQTLDCRSVNKSNPTSKLYKIWKKENKGSPVSVGNLGHWFSSPQMDIRANQGQSPPEPGLSGNSIRSGRIKGRRVLPMMDLSSAILDQDPMFKPVVFHPNRVLESPMKLLHEYPSVLATPKPPKSKNL